jgi:hypothetical protein
MQRIRHWGPHRAQQYDDTQQRNLEPGSPYTGSIQPAESEPFRVAGETTFSGADRGVSHGVWLEGDMCPSVRLTVTRIFIERNMQVSRLKEKKQTKTSGNRTDERNREINE